MEKVSDSKVLNRKQTEPYSLLPKASKISQLPVHTPKQVDKTLIEDDKICYIRHVVTKINQNQCREAHFHFDFIT